MIKERITNSVRHFGKILRAGKSRTITSLNLLDKLEALHNVGMITHEPTRTIVVGSDQPWAIAASIRPEGKGAATLKGWVKLTAGSMSLGLLSKDENKLLSDLPIPITKDFVRLEFPIDGLEKAGSIVFRTDDDGRVKPRLELRSLVLEPGTSSEGLVVDPIVENLWPRDIGIFKIAAMGSWSREQLDSFLSGDKWKDNLILNKWEFANGITRLESYPWRFSVPFVLCNARCEFCSAWLVQGEPMPIDLFDRLDVMLPYLAQIDMVGWGEPLIHPEFGNVVEKLKSRADPRARIALTTNGVHLGKWADDLLAANVRDFAVSIHAARRETHEDLMGLPPGSFDKVIDGVGKLHTTRHRVPGLDVAFVFIVTQQNLAEIPEFIALAQKLGVDRIFFRTLKARSAEEQRNDGLDYHRLPPYLHPQFAELRARAVEAIAAATIPIEAFPESWSANVFPVEVEASILQAPLTPRAVRLKSKSYRHTPAVDSEALPVGEPLEDGYPGITEELKNPYNRQHPLFCPSPYTAFYLNGFDRMVTPCCYMTSVPGHQPSYLRKGASFDDAWNSPAMIALRRSLNKGPLKSPCLQCAFYW